MTYYRKWVKKFLNPSKRGGWPQGALPHSKCQKIVRRAAPADAGSVVRPPTPGVWKSADMDVFFRQTIDKGGGA